MGRRIEVSRTLKREVYLHNILADLLHGINLRFDNLVTPVLQNGWKSEAVNGIIIMAMLNEGWMNAVGQTTISAWNPAETPMERLKKLRKAFLSDLHVSARPLSSVEQVRKIRNEFAHAKPLVEARTDEIVTIDEADQDAFFRDLRHPVEGLISVESYRLFRDDSRQFRQLLLDRSGLSVWDLRTKAEESSTFLREAE